MQSTLRPVTCVVCESSFQSTAANAMYCGARCRSRSGKRKAIAKRAAARALGHPPCRKCGEIYQPLMYRQRTCPRCIHTGTRGRCRTCGAACSAFVCDECQKQATRRGRRRYKARKRGAMRQDTYEPHQVYERDGWVCQLCGDSVLRSRRFQNDPYGPSIDHIVPLSKGGDDTLSNVHLAHFGCNSRKRGGL